VDFGQSLTTGESSAASDKIGAQVRDDRQNTKERPRHALPHTINAIAPALIETEMMRDNPRARPDLIPVGRFGTEDEVADVVVMLAGNGFITGQTINVNGGWYMS
jgi:NAD(P)-dependent dehydrogenase (short-subunit alcohol dehydrogenase family)